MCLSIFYPILSMPSIHSVFCKSNFSPLKLPGSSASPPKTPTLQRLLLRRMKFFAVSENPGACTGPTNIALGNYSLIEVNQEKINLIDWQANGLRSRTEFPLLFVQHMFSAKIMGLPTQCMHQLISYAVSDWHYQSTGILRRVHVQGDQKKGVWRGWNKLDQSVTCVSIFQTY